MIKVIDKNFNLLGEIDVFSSLQFNRKFFKPGGFELHLPVTAVNADRLVKGNIIFYDAGRKAGIIEHRDISQTDTENLVIKGYTLASFANRRVILPSQGQAYDEINAVGETVMKHYFHANCINPSDINRKINGLEMENDFGRGPAVNWKSRYAQMDEELEKIAKTAEMGWDIDLDLNNNRFVFKVLEGLNLTVNQEINPPVIFSVEFDNVNNQEFVDSNIGAKNYGYVGGQGEGIEREIVAVGDNLTDLERMETFIDARDVEDTDGLSSRGAQKLQELQPALSFTNEIINNTFKYEIDWNLGDVVTCQNKRWGITMDARITEVKEIYESSGFKLEVTFGNSLPTLTEKIKSIIDMPMTETPAETKYDDRHYTKNEVDTKIATNAAPTYVFTQMSPSSEWLVNHNLDKFPSVTIVDSGGSVAVGEIIYINNDSLRLVFSAAFAGNAYLN